MQESIDSKDVRIHPQIWDAKKHLLQGTVELTGKPIDKKHRLNRCRMSSKNAHAEKNLLYRREKLTETFGCKKISIIKM